MTEPEPEHDAQSASTYAGAAILALLSLIASVIAFFNGLIADNAIVLYGGLLAAVGGLLMLLKRYMPGIISMLLALVLIVGGAFGSLL